MNMVIPFNKEFSMSSNDPAQALQADLFFLGRPLPRPYADALALGGTGAMVNLPEQLVICGLSDYRDEDALEFRGPAQFRVGVAENFLLLSLAFRTIHFDIVWSPIIAQRTGEPSMVEPDAAQHMLMTFILGDDCQVVRTLRQATISPDCTKAIWAGQRDLSYRATSASALEVEMMKLFTTYQGRIPDGFFHASCALGD